MRTQLMIARCAGALSMVIACAAQGDALDRWTQTFQSTGYYVYGMAHANGTYVAVGANVCGPAYVLHSTDGRVWTQVAQTNETELFAVEYGADRFVAVGAGRAPVAVSTNGIHWSFPDVGVNTILFDVIFANGCFYAAGEVNGAVRGSISISDDGIHWTNRLVEAGVLFGGISFTANRFYLGATDKIYDSNDALTWHKWAGRIGFYGKVVSGNGRLIATSDWGLSWSTNGTSWSRILLEDGINLETVIFANGMFVAGGDGGTILTSVDGRKWTFRPPLAGAPTIYDIIYVDGLFTAATTRGIYQSDSTTTPCLSVEPAASGAAITLAIGGEVGREYTLQRTSSCAGTNWTDVSTFILEGPETNLLESIDVSRPQQLYRVVAR